MFTHWPLDAIEHEPELPLVYGQPMIGLSLWRVLPVAILLEAVLVAAGIALYWRLGRRRRRGVAIAAVVILAMTATQLFATQPPSIRGEAVTWILVAPVFGLLFGWLDQDR
ncbi:MAG TPA: hypothetical protein VM691_13470 [Myxococcales bacterium]|nr:hypothetical protein [Myxococcales bacterium]